jgi:hypothetical protein
VAGLSVRSDDEAKWSELEQAFFDAAPPDEPSAPPARIDNSLPMETPPPRDRLARLRLRSLTALAAMRASLQGLVRKLRAAPWFTAFTSPGLSRRSVAIGLASAIVLMGLSAGVVASRSGGGRAVGTPIAPAVSPATASADDQPASDVARVRASAASRLQTRAAKHPRARASAAKHANHTRRKPATRHTAR